MFRDTPVVNYSMREGLSAASTYSILALRDDSLWIGNEGAVDILKGGRHSLLAGKELSGSAVESLFQDHNGVVWLGVGSNLMTYEHGRLQKIQNLGESGIYAISEDTNQNIWALTERHRLFRIKDRIPHEVMSLSSDLRRTGFLHQIARAVSGSGEGTSLLPIISTEASPEFHQKASIVHPRFLASLSIATILCWYSRATVCFAGITITGMYSITAMAFHVM